MSEKHEIEALFENNRQWVSEITRDDPVFFARTASQQAPKYLWIGYSDSRVTPNQITGLPPGQLFVHRNVANVVSETDLNCMSVVDFALRILEVRHVIVCGHYDCAGVHAAMDNVMEGPLNHWLDGISELWELNVRKQMLSLCHTPSIEGAWRQRKSVRVHGWIYGLKDGLLRKLHPDIGSISQRTRAESELRNF